MELDELIQKCMWYIHAMEHYSDLKKEILPCDKIDELGGHYTK